MSNKQFLKLFKGSVLGIVSKIFDAVSKFITIPLLVGYFGKLDYGLIALAFSLNAYLRLMELGMNVGSIRFFSIWFQKKEYDKIISISQSSTVFYGFIGLVNALIFCVVGSYSDSIFDISTSQYEVFRWMMYILAASAIFNWVSFVMVQLLSAKERFSIIYSADLLKSFFIVLTAVLTVKLKMSLTVYFPLFILSNLSVIPIYILKLSSVGIGIFQLLKPKWNGKAFQEVLRYSIAIFILGIFQFTAKELRPILLGAFASNGLGSVTDFRVLQTISGFIIVIGGVFMQVLLPVASKNSLENENNSNEKLAYIGTKYITVVLSYIVFFTIINAEEILSIYMGDGFIDLSKWLIIWSITILLYLHNSPVSAMVLASGKTKPLVFSSAIGASVSVVTTLFLSPTLNVGAAVIGYLFYILIQMTFYYLYYIPRVLKLDSYVLFFKSFLPSSILSAIAGLISIASFGLFSLSSELTSVIVKTLFFSLIWIVSIRTFVIKRVDINRLKVWKK